MRRGWRATGALLAVAGGVSLLSGCASNMEQVPVDLHVVPTTVGVGWAYRAERDQAEEIIPGQKGDFTLEGDSGKLAPIWRRHGARVSVDSDSVSKMILIKMDDEGTQRRNPIKGGPMSWDLYTLKDMVVDSLPVLTDSEGAPRYSIHLVALADDPRPHLSGEDIAQIRLRRLASVLMDTGLDARLITGQTWGARPEPSWKLAIVLRPYRFGNERISGALASPEQF